jgi:pilus assembly protein CpaF
MKGGGCEVDNCRFDINSITRAATSEQKLNQRLIDEATKVVLKDMTEVKGSADEIETHNMILARCAMGDKSAQLNVKAMIKKIIEKDHNIAQPPLSDQLVKEIYANNYGLGAIDDLFNDPSINEIWVNGWEHIWIEKGGIKYRLNNKRFKSDEDIIRIIRLLLQFDKKDITIQEPMRESRMLDGSRITVLIPPIAKRPYINIRKFEAFELSTDNLLKAGTLTPEMVAWMEKAVRGRSNTLIIGETGSGKTSFLKWMVGLMDPKLRLGTIETNFELKIDEKYPDRNIFSYEEHPEIGITMGELFKKCLRSSPDIIICGEARGSEADELIRAMRRGHPGSVGTIHTNGPETAIDDVAEMINEDGKRRDPALLRYRIASSLDLIIQIRRFEDTGIRRVTRITEVISDPNTLEYRLNDIFRYDVDPKNPSKGQFNKVGRLSEDMKKKLVYFGIPYDQVKDM